MFYVASSPPHAAAGEDDNATPAAPGIDRRHGSLTFVAVGHILVKENRATAVTLGQVPHRCTKKCGSQSV